MNDICLILEGTYPYITGGVSSWIHQIISGLPEFTFEIITLVPNRESVKEYKYKIPPNVKKISNVYLQENNLTNIEFTIPKEDRKIFFTALSSAINGMIEGSNVDFSNLLRSLKGRKPGIGDILQSREGWDFMENLYKTWFSKSSFVDFFWTWRFIVLPFISLLQTDIPKARCYHTICTGYAGFLASIFKHYRNAPLLLTEHGIYTKERLMEIVDAEWIHSEKSNPYDLMEELPPMKRLWIEMFKGLGSITYDSSDKIITLYQENQNEQINFGADPARCSIIPNGIEMEKFELKRKKASRGPTYTIGFVGRIVPIKDIKTLIRTARLVVDRLPGAEFLLLGPLDEEPEYYEECKTLVEILDLRDRVRFLGPGDVTNFYPTLDLLLLTSISEAQPLVILEANTCLVPVVSTDVGSSRELLEGYAVMDVQLGPAGSLAPVMGTGQLAMQIVELLTNHEKNEQWGLNGCERVKKYYTKKKLIDSYREVYQGALKWQG